MKTKLGLKVLILEQVSYLFVIKMHQAYVQIPSLHKFFCPRIEYSFLVLVFVAFLNRLVQW